MVKCSKTHTLTRKKSSPRRGSPCSPRRKKDCTSPCAWEKGVGCQGTKTFPKKKCRSDKVFNPYSGRCVSRMTRIGRHLLVSPIKSLSPPRPLSRSPSIQCSPSYSPDLPSIRISPLSGWEKAIQQRRKYIDEDESEDVRITIPHVQLAPQPISSSFQKPSMNNLLQEIRKGKQLHRTPPSTTSPFTPEVSNFFKILQNKIVTLPVRKSKCSPQIQDEEW